MAFVFEELNSVEAQEIRNLVRDPVYAFQRGVAIDRERDLFFVDLGGKGDQPKERGEYPTYYNLLWKRSPIVFEGYDQWKNVDGVLNIDVEYSKMQIPKTLRAFVTEIQEFIVEASDVYWRGLLNKPVVVSVQFPIIHFY